MQAWQPTASLETLKKRAHVLQLIRAFFLERGVLEIETPLASPHTVTDPYIESVAVQISKDSTYYLQTSPEYAMKRFLACHAEPIYQITKAFRKEELGQFHNIEFSMLEWYRPGFTYLDLMQEVDALLQVILKTTSADCMTYQELFQSYLNINPLTATGLELKNLLQELNIVVAHESLSKDDLLQLLMSHHIEPQLGKEKPVFIYNYPASQAALAKIIPGEPSVAARFETYFKGIELANGFDELADANEQRKRFELNNQERKKLGFTEMQLDDLFLQALHHGLPQCAGVALGLDRLIMFAANKNSIKEVISFR